MMNVDYNMMEKRENLLLILTHSTSSLQVFLCFFVAGIVGGNVAVCCWNRVLVGHITGMNFVAQLPTKIDNFIKVLLHMNFLAL